jgi:methyltransferase family protein
VDLNQLLAEPPVLHVAADGTPAPFESSEEILRTIDEHVGDGSHTLETGAGLSTVLFALKGSNHTCVVPFAEEVDRIKKWCAGEGVSTERVRFVTERSEDALPAMDGEPLDLVLIDGGHAFPSPFIDWYYAARRLRPGGILIVDDTQLWTGRVLDRFLREEPGWERIRNVPMRASVFRCTAEPGDLKEWVHQPYVVKRSYSFGARGLVRQAVKAADAVRRGDFARLTNRR